MKKIQDRRCRIVEVPVHHYHRYHGSSQFFTFRHLSRVLIQLFTAWWELVALPCLPRRPTLPELEGELRRIGDIF
jgi:hypothetical protein